MTTKSADKRKQITYTIDGQSFTTRDHDREAGSMLREAGLDPALYDLAKVKKGGETKVFKDGHVIDLHDGDVFVSVKQSSSVA
jgi:hypothetical protein